ncbi:cation efflux protein [Thelephora terrestris]|uniref:Cation efflux protein n=1 Tax=Thelephora terrestris TaxID=56493 RepID=A0A9P6HEJ0_9AGAM|nr:cation efflux protein [Thelephora terrestris]
MAWSRSSKIIFLLFLDVIFFFVELIAGYAVGSLALVADAFHMLNDVMSLVVALYAIRLSAKSEADDRYTYGWHRAEILAALVNGVFLLALCFSVSLEALERFFSAPEITNPKLVVIVGSFGLASNIIGLFLFHEHGHGHGHDSHDHSDTSSLIKSSRASLDRGSATATPRTRSPVRVQERQPQPSVGHRRSQSIPVRQSTDSFIEPYGHPATLRESFIIAADEMRKARSPSPPPRGHANTFPTTTEESGRDRNSRSHHSVIPQVHEPEVDVDETVPLIRHGGADSQAEDSLKGKSAGGAPSHGHDHGSMNMKAILLHVLGDALGNVGVIATGLIIWQTTWSFKYYFDPVISLVITMIIFSSAMPLVRSTAYILLQGVPSNIALGEVRKAILQVKGVLDLHDLHVWQLSETKVVASVHISASRDYDFMHVAAQIQEALHHCGIHSATIQPEYTPQGAAIVRKASSTCLISCPSDQMCSADNTCCRASPFEKLP